MANFWVPIETQRKAWTPVEHARNFFLIRFVVNIVLFGLAVYGCYQLVGRAQTIPKVITQDYDGRVYEGTPGAYHINKKMIRAFLTDTLEATFARTEKGPLYLTQDIINRSTGKDGKEPEAALPYLNEMVSDKILNDAVYPESLPSQKDMETISGFTQQFVVLNIKWSTVTTSYIDAKVQGIFKVHNDTKYAATIVYLNTRLMNVGASEHNPLGWKLTDMRVVPESYWLQDVIQEQIKENTSDTGTTTSTQSDQATPTKGTAPTP